MARIREFDGELDDEPKITEFTGTLDEEPGALDELYRKANRIFGRGSVMDEADGRPGRQDPVAKAIAEKTGREYRAERAPAVARSNVRMVEGPAGMAEVAVRRGVGGLIEALGGAARGAGDAYNIDALARTGADLAESGTRFAQRAQLRAGHVPGFGPESVVHELPQAAANAGASILQTAPSLLANVVLPGSGLPLLFAQTGAQEYGQGREAGLNPAGALLRAAPQAAAEVVGEKVGGFDALTKGIREAITDNAVEQFGRTLIKSGWRELPGEELTTTLQFLTDKAPGIGINQEATLADYTKAVKDTALATLLQSGAMTGGGAVLERAAKMADAANNPVSGLYGKPQQEEPGQKETGRDISELADAIAKTANIPSANIIEAPDDIELDPVPGQEAGQQAGQQAGQEQAQAETPMPPAPPPAVDNPDANTGTNFEKLVPEQNQAQTVPENIEAHNIPTPEKPRPAYQVPLLVSPNAMQVDTPTEGLRPGDVIGIDGAPFATKAKADKAKKDAGKGWAVKRANGGFVVRYQPQTDAQKKALQGRLKKQASIDTERDSMFAAIAKLGGINAEEVKSEWGFSDDLRGLRGAGIKRVATTTGHSIDTMGEMLAEQGYLSVDENGKYDRHEFEDLFGGELAGHAHYTPEGFERMAEQMQQERGAEFEDGLSEEDIADSGFDSLPEDMKDAAEGYLSDYEESDDELEARLEREAIQALAAAEAASLGPGGRLEQAAGRAEPDTGREETSDRNAGETVARAPQEPGEDAGAAAESITPPQPEPEPEPEAEPGEAEGNRAIAGRLDHGELNVKGRTDNINRELDRYKKEQERLAKTKAKATAQQTREEKALAKKLLNEYEKEILEKHQAKFGKKELKNTLDQWAKWEPHKLISFVDKFIQEKNQLAAQEAQKGEPREDEPRNEPREDEDSADSGIPFSGQSAPSQDRKAASRKAAAVRAAIAGDTYNHDIDVYATLEDAPDYVQQQAKRERITPEGFYDPRTGRVAIIASNVTVERAVEVARHELIGHYGLETMLGRDEMRLLVGRVIKAEAEGNKAIIEVAKHVDRTQPGLSPERRAKEIIAVMAERNMQNSIVRRVMDAIRKFLKEIGFTKGDITDAEIAGLLRDTQAYLREQGRAMVAGEPAPAAFSPVYHGTPHVWPPEPGFPHGRPRLDKIGSGEGAAAYGWGWYSAENPGVAHGYKEALTDSFRFDGKEMKRQEVEDAVNAEYPGYLDGVIRASGVAGYVMDAKPNPYKAGSERARVYDAIRSRLVKIDSGSLYQLDIPDAVLPHLLDWDKPLSAQTPGVRKALEAALLDYQQKRRVSDRYMEDNFSGPASRIYQELAAQRGAQGASEYLASLGIIGNRYLDGLSRGRKDGTYNFVIWDQPTLDKVALLKRNGEKLDAIREAEFSAGLFDQEPTALEAGRPLTRTEVLEKQDKEERLAKEAAKPEKKKETGKQLRGDQVDLFNPQSSLFSGKKADDTVSPLKAKLIEAKKKFKNADRKKVDIHEYFALSKAISTARDELAAAIEKLPDEGFMLSGQTGNGRLMTLNQSAQKANHWQLTRFDSNGEPWGDTQYSTKRQAIKEYLQEVDPETVTDYEVSFSGKAPAKQTDTPAFKRWFRNSKVVDAEGRPLVVYHGTTADVTEFSLDAAGADGVKYSVPAIFATSDTKLASDYAINKFDRVIADATRALEQFKNRNPGTYDERYDAAYDAVQEAFKTVKKEGRWETGGGANVLPLYMSLQNPLEVDGNGKRFMAVMPDAIARAMAEGRDGLIVNNVIDNASPATNYPAQVFIAFKPTQIKSATGNRGTFDPENPDILFSGKEPAKQTDTPAFKRWFGDSKITDKDGKPLTVYHGTANDFSVFAKARAGASTGAKSAKAGFWFVDDRETASNYADLASDETVRKLQSDIEKAERRGDWDTVDRLTERMEEHGLAREKGQNIIPAFLKMRKPFIFEAGGESFMDLQEEINRSIKTAKDGGYDGIIFTDLADDPNGIKRAATHYLVFEPGQIKSAMGNRGTFDPENPDILFSGKEQAKQTDTPAFKRWFGNSQVVDENGEPLVLYRGVIGGTEIDERALNAEPRSGYATFASNNPYVAASYAHPESPGETGALVPVFVKANRLIEFPVQIDRRGGRNFSKTDFDRAARSLRPGEVLVARKVYDIGPRASMKTDPAMQYSYASDIYAWGSGTQIKSATGNTGDFDPENPDIRFSGKEPEPHPQQNLELVIDPITGKDFVKTERDTAGRRRYVAGRKMYDAIARHAVAVLDKVKLADNSPENFKAMMRNYRVDMAKAQANAEQVAKIGLEKLTAAERKMLSDVIEGNLAPTDLPPETVLRIATEIQTALRQQGQDLVELGMLTEDRLIQHYLPRVYRNPLLARFTNKAMFLSWYQKARLRISGARMKSRGLIHEIRPTEWKQYRSIGWKLSSMADGSEIPADLREALMKGTKLPPHYPGNMKFLVWRDFTRDEREQMGEIHDGLLRYALGYVETQRDIAIGRLFKAIASDQTLASKINPGGWAKVPDEEIIGADGVKRFGALSGMYVPEMVRDMIERSTQAKGPLMQVYDRALNFWKEGKTIWNPVSHGNNIVSNVFTIHFAGLNPADPRHWRRTIQQYRKKGNYYQEAINYGLFGTEWASKDIQDLFLPELVGELSVENISASRFNKVMNFLKKTGKPVAWYRDRMQRAYEFEDQFFKLMLFIDRREGGASIPDAINDTERYVFNYADVPEGVETLKRVYSPFISYTYKALPMLLHTAMTRPDRLLAPIFLLGGANWLAYALMGGDEDEERKNMPEYLKGRTAIGTPKAIRMPFDVEGKPAYMDMTRRVPLGDLFDMNNQTGGIAAPAPMMPSHPLFTAAAALFFNKDTFTGKDITKPSDTDWEVAQKRADWIYKQIIPNAPFIPGSWNFDKLMNGAAYAFDTDMAGYTGYTKSGDAIPLGLALLDVAGGTKIRASDPARNKDFREYELDRERKEIMANIRSAQRNKAMTPDKKQDYIERQREKLQEVTRRRQELN